MAIIGTQQSPVRINSGEAIRAVFPATYFRIGYADKDLAGSFKDDNFNFTDLQTITFRGRPWELRKIHIHRPAEHLIDSATPAAYECHLVHHLPGDTAETGPKVVIGVFFHKDPRATTPASIARLNEALRRRKQHGFTGTKWGPKEQPLDVQINPHHFLPKDRDRWFHYEGSLTSGSFSEDVSWVVMPNEIGVNPKDTDQLELHAEQEARPVFQLNRRFVLRSFE